jgi:hypothetical protein
VTASKACEHLAGMFGWIREPAVDILATQAVFDGNSRAESRA